MRRFSGALAIASLTLVSAAIARADGQVTVGTTGTSSNCLPFGCAISGFNEYQQVYSSTAFSGPFNIGSLSFFHTVFLPGTGVFAPGTYNFFFGTTTKSVNGLDPAFANNETSPLSFFASLTIPTGTSAAGSTFTVVGTPYLYNPATGNLLLDVQYTNSAVASTFFDTDISGSVTSRVAGVAPAGTPAPTALITRFDAVSVSTTPEPASVALVGTGLILLATFARRRSRTASSV